MGESSYSRITIVTVPRKQGAPLEPKLEPSPRLRFLDENGQPYPDWEEKKLGDAVVETTRKTKVQDEYPVLSSSMKGILLQSDYFGRNVSSANNVGYKVIFRGEATYRSMSDNKKFTFNKQDKIDCGIVSPAYPVFSSNTGYDIDFLIYYMNLSSSFDKEIKKILQGGTRGALRFSSLRGVNAPLPSLPEQEKIGEFLSSLDTEVEQAERLVSLLSDRKKAYAQRIFDRTLRFHDDNDNPYPKWEEKRLGEMSDFVNGYAFKSSEYTPNGKHKVVTIKNVTGDTAVQTESCDRLDKLPPNLSPSHRLKIGDILISLTGNVGRVSTVFEENLLLNQRVGLIIPHHNVAKPFILAYLRDRILSHLESQSQGGAQKNISKGNIVNLPIPLPSLPEQEKIGSFLSSLDDEIDEAKRELGLLKERKKAYAQKIFGV